MRKEWRVIWEIDVLAESPEEAARRALEIQRNPESDAVVFDVLTDSAGPFRIGLLSED